MNILCIIPARMGSSRFPGKPMEKILLGRKYVEPVEITKARGEIFNIPFVQVGCKNQSNRYRSIGLLVPDLL